MYVKCCTSVISKKIRTTTLHCADTRAFSLDTLDSGSASITDLQITSIIYSCFCTAVGFCYTAALYNKEHK